MHKVIKVMSICLVLIAALIALWFLILATTPKSSKPTKVVDGVLYHKNINKRIDGLLVVNHKWGKSETNYLNGLKHGAEKQYDLSGQLTYEAMYKHGQKDGIENNYRMKEMITYKNGKKNGLEVHYDKEYKSYECNFINNNRDGLEIKYHRGSNIPKMVTPFVKGVPNGIQKEYDNKGKLLCETTLQEGLKHGLHRRYRDDVVVKEETYFEEEQNGIAKEWYSTRSGKFRKEIPYVNGLKHGVAKTFSIKTGKVVREVFYENGIEKRL